MKKSLLLLTAGLISALANAQENRSIMLNPGNRTAAHEATAPGHRVLNTQPDLAGIMNRRNAEARTTSAAAAVVGTWFSFDLAHDDGTFVNYDNSSNTGNYGAVDVFNDSTLYVSAGTPPFYWWCHGLGVSFNPYSSWFSSNWQNTSYSAPFTIGASDDYYVDSVLIIGRYFQTNTTETDTLHIDIAGTNTTGSTNAWDLQTNGTDLNTYGITVAPNDTYRFAVAAIDSTGFSSTSTTAVSPLSRISKVLNHAAAIDTDATSGWNIWSFPLTGGSMHIDAGGHLAALATFHTGVYYPYGSSITTANIWSQDSWYFTDNAGGLQLPDDVSTGLMVSSDDRYATANAEVYGTTVIPTPSYFYTAPLCVQNPYIMFYLRSPGSTNVNKIQKLEKVNAYPNPATNELNISFSTSSAATVTLTDMVGQTVATQSNVNSVAKFNTAALANGMYIYTIQAGTARTTGHVVVAH